ncbi:hypothetical protein NC652_037610 [Populus alba x Populus x berolinensis]|uniref:Uncharacterized protein n=1 Tax=Populus alba x Populus x berolinensis TaxID=444605 RepID=A0AAD6PS92_9ROSI|nr:hypothetical protein NC652_037610 [Populus alba x Populus x berolinensis]KAJ6959200.1 hypothetical protein NC653_037492 [Populus alba x Populus x berolinensis]
MASLDNELPKFNQILYYAPIDTKDFKASCSSMEVADACPTEDFMITCK